MAKLTPAAHAARIRKVQEKLRNQVPSDLAPSVHGIWQDSRLEIETLFPNRTAGRDAKGLYKGEKMEKRSENCIAIVNVAANKGYRYGMAVHQGLPALVAPTKLRGKKFYVWMLDMDVPRPRTAQEWKLAKKRGVVAMAKKLKSRSAKPWRYNAVMRNHHLVANNLVKLKQLINNGF